VTEERTWRRLSTETSFMWLLTWPGRRIR